MQQTISGWIFDLSKPVYLEHPNRKFWQLKLSGINITYKVGKIRDGTQTNIQQVDKDYSSVSSAKTTAITKIQQKLTKGYLPRDAKRAQQQEKNVRKRGNKKQQKKQKRVFSGEYYQKDSEGIKLQVKDRRVKITKNSGSKQGFEIRSFDSHQQAVDFCIQEQTWLLSEGYRAINSKFIYSFIEQEQQKSRRKKKQQVSSKNTNFLSITKMTDDAISHRSRNQSSAKSDRSYNDDQEQNNSYVSGKLGSPTSSCIKVLLAEQWNNQIDPKGWIMSQKLDGVRCFWTGTTMYSRNQNRFIFPKFFTRGWPKSQLDGELFIDRGKFSKTISAIKKKEPIDEEWKNVKYLVFDCPGLKAPFKKRIQMMQKVIGEIDNPYIKCHAHRECKGYDDMFAELENVNKIEGEGLMLRDPQSFYENRRSKTLLKVKTFHDDEATVIGYKEGTGRCMGMVGALKVRNTHGVEFEVGSGMTDQIRRKPPKIGTKITYKYQEFNKDSGKPRFPTYMRKFDSSI